MQTFQQWLEQHHSEDIQGIGNIDARATRLTNARNVEDELGHPLSILFHQLQKAVGEPVPVKMTPEDGQHAAQKLQDAFGDEYIVDFNPEEMTMTLQHG